MKIDYAEHYKRINFTNNIEETYNGAKSYYNAELPQILKYVNKNKPVLEIGPGYGYLAKYLIENGFNDVTCVDYSQGLLDIIKSWVEPCPKLICMDGNKFLKEKKNEYGLIIMYDLIEHIPTDIAVEFASNAYNALAENGILVIRTPNMANILGLYSRYIDITHCQGYTHFSLTQVLENGGFSTEKINVWQSQWPVGSVMYKNKLENDALHNKLFKMHDRAKSLTFEKELLMSAKKGGENIISTINSDSEIHRFKILNKFFKFKHIFS